MRTPQQRYQQTNYWGFVGSPKMFLAKNDDGVAMRLLDGEAYEPQSMKLWVSLAKSFAVDVGAHTGIYTLNALQNGCRLCSIEPYFMNFARLVMNVKANNFSTDGLVFGAASSKNAVSSISSNCPVDYCSTGGGIAMGGRSYPIILHRLDDLIHESHHSQINVIKIDTENHCKEVLKGMPEILKNRPKLIFECTEEGIQEILDPLGYHYFMIDEQTGLEPVKDLIPEFDNGKPIMTRLNRYAV